MTALVVVVDITISLLDGDNRSIITEAMCHIIFLPSSLLNIYFYFNDERSI